MARNPLATPAQGSESWYGWATQLTTEHEALRGAGGITDQADRAQIRTNLDVYSKAEADAKGGMANALPGTTIRCLWNGTAWTINGAALSARPSSRTDIYFDLVGSTAAASGGPADPSWLINGDSRTDVA